MDKCSSLTWNVTAYINTCGNLIWNNNLLMGTTTSTAKLVVQGGVSNGLAHEETCIRAISQLQL